MFNRKSLCTRKLRMEKLEDRRLLATVTVTTMFDLVDANTSMGIAALISNPGLDGKISLREAIEAANETPLADRIDFSTDPLDALNGATITLNENVGVSTAGKELEITDSVTIDASALSQGITISGTYGVDGMFGTGDGARIFNIDDALAIDIDVTLRGLTITGGDLQTVLPDTVDFFGEIVALNRESFGGAIFSAENLTLDNTAVSNNAAVAILTAIVDHSIGFNGLSQGGGIYSTGPELRILNGSAVTGNMALVDFSGSETKSARSEAEGGGIWINSSLNTILLEISESTIGDNTAKVDLSRVALVGLSRPTRVTWSQEVELG